MFIRYSLNDSLYMIVLYLSHNKINLTDTFQYDCSRNSTWPNFNTLHQLDRHLVSQTRPARPWRRVSRSTARVWRRVYLWSPYV